MRCCALSYNQIRKHRGTDTELPLMQTKNRIESIALLHERLYQSDSISNIDLERYVRDLVRQLKTTYRPTNRTVDMETNVTLDTLKVDQAIACGLILNDAVSNCLEHASDGGEGQVTIELAEKNDKVTLAITDNGNGIDKDVEQSNQTSHGLGFIRTLTEDQLNGSLSLTREGGTHLEISFSKK
ncbi:MAG: sensor histidine kinase [bacterium]